MKFETLEIKFEKYEILDIIASSPSEEPTVTPTEPTTKYDPYENDKW
ncbi:MAG: hypothetical protein IJD90_01785 [Clostridia bacterium]|nr:hypothetical protein [Clostridia bacterium]